jgi:hypothetical protein
MSKHVKGQLGRPPLPYNKQIADKILLLISTTMLPIRKICKKNKRFPKVTTLYRWLLDNEEFAKKYARAQLYRAQIMADQLAEIADKVRPSEVVITDHKGRKKTRLNDGVDRARLQIDTRKWMLAHLLPDKYGDKIQVDTGKDTLAELLQGIDALHGANVSKRSVGRPPKSKPEPDNQE